ncbi:hypothetical protein NEUTE1DRAFT_140931 [Neurospora tetrasperma FGSC 2508]|uniref:Uncharacterized protein n=1 Tax=Neurospora tetrasperma (strain FGSC 2508 / ATCC MYA-4615 / P0657) TaxID=510951 RepID=F8MV14_NEUT8|nr:uncharacterized protein NEUTE1DRAFT_140931 [Neurospora tetrasperma FGSC 2508]EGO54639.1 hypothetical protein NEUTE1DRAFT_140931 [Neurospora tetrasperma FGSC 2508]EGZ67904.1 hypothetical protein NEUTE2DRAFT_169713 [Neurospora tetrasperma FGSC 2509]
MRQCACDWRNNNPVSLKRRPGDEQTKKIEFKCLDGPLALRSNREHQVAVRASTRIPPLLVGYCLRPPSTLTSTAHRLSALTRPLRCYLPHVPPSVPVSVSSPYSPYSPYSQPRCPAVLPVLASVPERSG